MEQANELADLVEGMGGTCCFDRGQDLSELFARWKDGRFSTEDWEGVDCEGTMFGE